MKVLLTALDAGGPRSRKSTIENIVNMYAEPMNKKGISQYVLYQCSGLTEFCNLGTDKVIQLYTTSDGQVFAFTKNKLYKIFADKTHTLVATITGTLSDFISVADNGNQMCFVDGSRGFVYRLDTNVLTEITTQTGFYPSNTVVFLDGYFIFNRSGTGQFFISALYDTTTDPLDFATAESSPDDTVGIIVFSNQLWLFGQKTIEIWYNSGDSLFPFSRVSGGVLNRGCQAFDTIKKGALALYFVGDDGIVYVVSTNSYVPQKVSTYSIEKDITGETLASAFVFTEYGHEFYMLQLPNNERTWCYDISSGLWHERKSTVINPIYLVPEQKRHISKCYTSGYDTKLIGSRIDGKVYYLDKMSAKDNNQVMFREINTSPMFQNNDWIICRSFEAVVEVDLNSNIKPMAMLQWSDDNTKWSDGFQMQIAELGNFTKRFVARRLGRFRERTFRLRFTDDVVVKVVAMIVEVEQ